jgi:RimJ/RimL family protein N-acetyltransferase
VDVQLRPIRADEAEAIAAGRLPPGLAFADGYPTEFSKETAERVGAPAQLGPLFIVRREDDVVVGEIGAALVGEDTAEIGYAVAASCQGRGYATAAVEALVSRLRRSGDVARVIAHTPADRPASARVLEKAGFARGPEVDLEDEGATLRVTRWELALPERGGPGYQR